MEISFAQSKLQKLCNNSKKLRGEFGPKCAEKIARRLAEMEAADSLEELRLLPQSRCHELTGDYDGCLAVDLQHPLRLVFQPNHKPLPLDKGGGLVWAEVTRLLILEVTNYH